MYGKPGLLLAVSALLLWGCGSNIPEYPRVTKAPEELGFYANFEAARLPLPKRTKIRQMAYAPPAGGDPKHSGEIIITEYEGVATRAEVEESRDAYAKRYGNKSTEYGPVEDFRADRRPAWGWTEKQIYKDEVASLTQTLVIPYEQVTYSIEVDARKKEWQTSEFIQSVATSFEVPRKGSRTATGLILFGVLSGILTWVYWKIQEAERSRS